MKAQFKKRNNCEKLFKLTFNQANENLNHSKVILFNIYYSMHNFK